MTGTTKVEVEPDNYFNPGTPTADFRVDSHGVAEVLTDRAPTIRQQSQTRGNDLTSDDGMIVVWGDEEYPF